MRDDVQIRDLNVAVLRGFVYSKHLVRLDPRGNIPRRPRPVAQLYSRVGSMVFRLLMVLYERPRYGGHKGAMQQHGCKSIQHGEGLKVSDRWEGCR